MSGEAGQAAQREVGERCDCQANPALVPLHVRSRSRCGTRDRQHLDTSDLPAEPLATRIAPWLPRNDGQQVY
jgi:hypothetical protein